MNIAKGLKHLGFTSLVDFVLRDDNGTTVFEEWNSDKQQPTLEEIQAANDVWQTQYDAQEYARKRSAEYPSIVDQLDKIYHDGIDEWKKVIKATKDKYPKS